MNLNVMKVFVFYVINNVMEYQIVMMAPMRKIAHSVEMEHICKGKQPNNTKGNIMKA